MTCIVGLVDNGRVYMGADSIGSDGFTYNIRAAPKVFKRGTGCGQFLFGYTTSFRFGELLEFKLEIPAHPDKMSDRRYMATLFIDAVRKTLLAGGWAKKKDEEETGGTALIGYKGQLWRMDDDYQIAPMREDGEVVGSGTYAASGALYVMRSLSWVPKLKVRTALEAADASIITVRGPFRIISGAEKRKE